jgi:hypothetical protein
MRKWPTNLQNHLLRSSKKSFSKLQNSQSLMTHELSSRLLWTPGEHEESSMENFEESNMENDDNRSHEAPAIISYYYRRSLFFRTWRHACWMLPIILSFKYIIVLVPPGCLHNTRCLWFFLLKGFVYISNGNVLRLIRIQNFGILPTSSTTSPPFNLRFRYHTSTGIRS